MNKNSGFTIVELVVVLVIIGILAAMALPQYMKTVERSRQSEALTNLGAIRGAQIRYNLENALWAGSFDVLDIDNTSIGTYFNYWVIDNVTIPGVVGSATRNTNKNPGYGGYNITIAVNGTTNKSGCPAVGCP